MAGVPVLIFANKQDLLQALPCDEVNLSTKKKNIFMLK